MTSTTSPSLAQTALEGVPSAMQENIDLLNDYQEREEAEVPRLQQAIESLSQVFGSPAYLVFAFAFMSMWVLVNLWGWHAGWRHVDEPPFFWLQGLVSSNALLLTVAVLIRQNRMGTLAARRAHLDLHVNLLTERKVSKAVELLDQLVNHHLPETPQESEANELAKPADPQAILAAIDDAKLPAAPS